MRTRQIEDELSEAEVFDEQLINENCSPELCVLLQQNIDRKGLRKSEVIRKLNIDRNYGYQLLNGARRPTREQLIQLGLLLELDTESLQQLLKVAEKKPLYVRNLFDAKVFYAIKHKMGYDEAMAFVWGDDFP